MDTSFRVSSISFRSFSFFLYITAIAVGFTYIYQISNYPLFNIPFIDSEHFVGEGKLISQGDLLLMGKKSYWKPPLYSYVLGLLFTLCGESLLAARVVNILFFGCNIVLIYCIGRKVLSETGAKIVAMVAIGYGPFIYFSGEIIAESLNIFLNLLLVLFFFLFQEKPSVKKSIASGIIFGLSLLCRPNIVSFLPVYIIGLYVVLREYSLKEKGVFIGSFLLSLFFILLPPSLRNYSTSGVFTPLSWNGGINFYIGNNLSYDQASGMWPPTLTWDKIQDDPVFRGVLDEYDRSDFLLKKGLAEFIQEPVAHSGLLLKKMYLFWNAHEISNNLDIYSFRKHSLLLKALVWKGIIGFPFGILGPLSLLGGVLVLVHKRKEFYILVGYVVFYISFVILFFNTARYRILMVPLLLLFAGYAGERLFLNVQKKKYTSLLSSLIAIGILTIFLNYGIHRTFQLPPHEGIHFGMHLKKEGKLREALSVFLIVIEELSNDPLGYMLAGNTYLALGEVEKSEIMFRAITEIPDIQPDWVVDAKVHLSALWETRKDYDKAIVEYREIIAMDPDRLFYKGKPYFQLGDPPFRTYDMQYQIARLLLQKGEVKKAYDILVALDKKHPYKKEVHSLLGTLYYEGGRVDAAAEQYAQAIHLGEDDVSIISNMGFIYYDKKDFDTALKYQKQALSLDETYPNTYFGLALIYERRGEVDQARNAWRAFLRYAGKTSKWREVAMMHLQQLR